MKRFFPKSLALAFISTLALACETTNDANEKIEQCLAEQYGADRAEELMPDWELSCQPTWDILEGEGDDDPCDTCIECVLGATCHQLIHDEICARDCADAD